MKRLLLGLLLVLAACGGKTLPSPDAPEALPFPIALLGKYGAAHACPVEGKVVTAGHVAYKTYFYSGIHFPVPLGYAAEDAAGRRGLAWPLMPNNYLDLAVLKLDFETTYYERGDTPQVDDEVTWVEYDFRSVNGAYKAVRRKSKVANVRVGHVVLSETATPGASGTCVFDQDNKVVGIIAWGQETMDGMATVVVALEDLP